MNGFLCIADLFKEDGSFHGNGLTGHTGFDPEELKSKMENIGFASVKYEECFAVKKIIDSKEKIFPLFLMTGKRFNK